MRVLTTASCHSHLNLSLSMFLPVCAHVHVYAYLEPVNGTTVDEGWELSHAVTEGVPDGAEGNDDVEVLSTTVHKEGKQSQRTEVSILVFFCRLSCWSNSLEKKNQFDKLVELEGVVENFNSGTLINKQEPFLLNLLKFKH